MLLRLVHEGAECLAQWAEPLGVVYQLAEGDSELLLLVQRELIQADALERAVRRVQDGAARRLVYAAALDADEPVLHDVQQADAVGPADLVELEDDLLGAELLTVEGDRDALLEIERDIGRSIGGLQRGDAHLEEALLLILRLVARVLEVEALVREVPEVLVLGVVGLAADLEGDVVRLGVVDLLLARLDGPLPPGGDDRHIRRKVLDRQLKTDLVVTLAGAAVGDGVGVLLLGDLHQALGDHRPGMGRAEQIILVHSARLEARHDVVVDVLLGQVQHIELRCTGLQRLLLQALKLVRLADVARDRDDLAVVVVLLEPGDDDRCIQTAGIGEHDFFDVFFVHGFGLLE